MKPGEVWLVGAGPGAPGLITLAGLERVRFTSPHPRDFTDGVIDAMAQTGNVMPQLHMPLQSGGDRVLAEMRRSYRSERYLSILERVRERLPQAAITTDITTSAIHMRQKLSTTPPTPALRPNTPPVDQKNVAPSSAARPSACARRLRDWGGGSGMLTREPR